MGWDGEGGIENRGGVVKRASIYCQGNTIYNRQGHQQRGKSEGDDQERRAKRENVRNQ